MQNINKDISNKIFKIFKKYNLSNEHSKICSEAIIYAELIGAKSHGLMRLKMYCKRIKKKLINSRPKFKIKKISENIIHLDADNSIGFVAADTGIKIAIKVAKKKGMSIVGIKNSNHYGLSRYYAQQATRKNLIALCFTNAPPAIAPYGSKKALFGTNPICFSSPSGTKIPFILDTSVSKINRGKIRNAAKLGKKIPNGVALDKSGKETTDPKKALKGVQLPIARYRGSGLAWMVDILSGVFTGANHGGKVKDPFDDFSGPQNVGHLFIVFKNSLFTKNYNLRMKKNINIVKKLPKIKGTDKILYPGEDKINKMMINLKKKIIIPEKILKEIDELILE